MKSGKNFRMQGRTRTGRPNASIRLRRNDSSNVSVVRFSKAVSSDFRDALAQPRLCNHGMQVKKPSRELQNQSSTWKPCSPKPRPMKLGRCRKQRKETNQTQKIRPPCLKQSQRTLWNLTRSQSVRAKLQKINLRHRPQHHHLRRRSLRSNPSSHLLGSISSPQRPQARLPPQL